MIIIKLTGGLGNQMFQYAVGRRVAYVNNTTLMLDITGYENQAGITKRKYLLYIFNIKEDFANVLLIKNIKRITPFFSRFIPYYWRTYIKEKHFHYDPNILKIRDNTYLEGYWQCEKYFKNIEDIIRKEFTFKDRPDAVNLKMIRRIKNYDSISIHIRHGDYVFDKKTSKHHGICDIEYYLRAADLLAKKFKKPYFFIFSDDIKWVKHNLHLKYPYDYVDHNDGEKDYEDMRLMSECKHNIIANSSFSWWGAWLNKNKNKIVIAPKKWFRNPKKNIEDLIPEKWIRI